MYTYKSRKGGALIKHLTELIDLAKHGAKQRLVVIAAQDDDVLSAVVNATKQAIIEPILVGDANRIIELLEELGETPSDYRILPAIDLEDCAKVGLELFKNGQADFIMKGLIDTSILLKNVLNREYGLRQDGLISHVMVYEFDRYHKLIGMTDGGMNIAPTLEQKKQITDNAIKVFQSLGYDKINIAALAAKEKANDKMPVTLDAKALSEMEWPAGVQFEGPLALDLCLSAEAAEVKGFTSNMAGDVDVIIVPTIEVGNALGKSITYIGGGESAGIIMGAKVPIVLVSRADTAETKLYSIALGKMISQHEEEK